MSDDDLGRQERFHHPHYLAHNQARQGHLASLGLPISGSVLEVGAGIGDHSPFFIERGCSLTITEGRAANLALARRRFPDLPAYLLDLDAPESSELPAGRFDIVYCYGVLYHLARPAEALAYMASRCDGMLLLSTCVWPGAADQVHLLREPPEAVENALSGIGCRPTRRWVWRTLGEHFDHVYVPTTQPDHPEFCTDWTTAPANPWLVRAVFIASRRPLDHPSLSRRLLEQQASAATS